MLINVNQLDQTQLTLAIQQASSGSFSGNFTTYVASSGWVGPTALWVTGGIQSITGQKTFLLSPIVPYSGGTGVAPSTQFVLDQDTSVSGVLISSINSLSGIINTRLISSGAAVSSIKVTGSNVINVANFTGLGGTLIIYSGNQIFISGAAGGGGGGGSNVQITGSSILTTANITGIGTTIVTYDGTFIKISGTAGGGSNINVTGSSNLSTINLTGIGTTVVTYDGTYVKISGAASTAGNGAPNAVFQTGDQNISGFKVFTGSILVAAPTLPSGAVNLLYLGSVSGVLAASISGMTGYIQSNTFNITGTGTINNTFTASGNINNIFNVLSGTVNNSPTTINISGVTGNFVNLSFYFDEFNLNTGLNQIEAFVGRAFFFTGYAIGVITSGTQGFLSGSFYQRTQSSTKVNFADFSLNSGQFFTGVGGRVQVISGLNRVGLDIYQLGTGMTGLAIGLFGVGY